MKILMYRWNAWNQLDIEQTLLSLGHTLEYWTEPPQNAEDDTAYTHRLSSHLQKVGYDILFSINFFPPLADACHDASVLYVCWNCDGSLLSMYHESVFHPTNRIFTFDRSCQEEFRRMGVEHIFHLPLGFSTIPREYTAPKGPDKDYEVSFVGSLYEKNSFDRIEGKLPDYLAGYLDGALWAQQQISGGNLLEPMLTPAICAQLEEMADYQRSPRSFADISKLFATTVLGFKAANLQRIHTLNSLSVRLRQENIRVHLFTGDLTHRLPLTVIHGTVDYLREMPYIFRHSRINLNMTVPTIPTGIPLRIWDILGQGGFLITNYQSELTEHFTPDRELVIYESQEELLDKAAFYLNHEALRLAIARRARELVCREHTLAQRLELLLKQLD